LDAGTRRADTGAWSRMQGYWLARIVSSAQRSAGCKRGRGQASPLGTGPAGLWRPARFSGHFYLPSSPWHPPCYKTLDVGPRGRGHCRSASSGYARRAQRREDRLVSTAAGYCPYRQPKPAWEAPAHGALPVRPPRRIGRTRLPPTFPNFPVTHLASSDAGRVSTRTSVVAMPQVAAPGAASNRPGAAELVVVKVAILAGDGSGVRPEASVLTVVRNSAPAGRRPGGGAL
jgi:hypothetical protein